MPTYVIFQTVNSICTIHLHWPFNIHCRYDEKDIFIHVYLQYVTPSNKHRFPSALVRRSTAMQKAWGSNVAEGSKGVFFH